MFHKSWFQKCIEGALAHQSNASAAGSIRLGSVPREWANRENKQIWKRLNATEIVATLLLCVPHVLMSAWTASWWRFTPHQVRQLRWHSRLWSGSVWHRLPEGLQSLCQACLSLGASCGLSKQGKNPDYACRAIATTRASIRTKSTPVASESNGSPTLQWKQLIHRKSWASNSQKTSASWLCGVQGTTPGLWFLQEIWAI